jgi:hypothetical protein
MKKQINIGDTFEVEMLPNKNGIKPICRIEGMICFISHDDKENPKTGETWLVGVSEIRDRCIIVMPVWKEKTAKETELLKDEKIRLLLQNTVKKEKHIQPKKHYQYMRSDEMRKMLIK